MRISLCFALVCSVLMCGCEQQPPPNNNRIEIEVMPGSPVPPLPPSPPTPPPNPAPMFMLGYWDGYHGRYVTTNWAYFEYRSGHDLGTWDRAHGIHNRYPPRVKSFKWGQNLL